MAYQLRSTGLATSLTMCLAVDEDGTTIREFVNPTVDAQKTVDAGVTVGSENWKGTPRGYFATTSNGAFDFHGIRFGTTRPPWEPADGDGCTIFGACAAMGAGNSSGNYFLHASSDTQSIVRDWTAAPNSAAFRFYDGLRGKGNTALPNDGTSFSFAVAYNATSANWYFGLESGSLAADGTSTGNSGYTANSTVAYVGGWPGQGYQAASWHLLCIFNRTLTLEELQSLHDDWFNVLFESSVVTEQEGFRFGADDGSESTYTWLAAQDVNVTHPLDTNLLLRVLLNATGDPPGAAYTLRYQKNGSGGYLPVPVGPGNPETFAQPTFGAIGTGANGSTSCAPSYPTGISAATSKLYCMVCSGASTQPTPTMPSGWTQIGTLSGGSGATYGLNVGNRRVTWFKKDTVDGTETGTVTVSLSGGNTMHAHIMRIEVPAGYEIEEQFASGQDTTHDTSWSVTATTAVDLDANRLVLVGTAQCTDSATQSAQAISASGITFGTRTNRASTAVTTGNYHRYVLDSIPITSGSGNVSPTWSHTNSANASGVTTFLVLRARLPEVVNELYVAQSANIPDGGEDTTPRLDPPSGKTIANFVTGRRWDDENGTDIINITADGYAPVEWCLRAQAPAQNGDYYEFRVYAGSTALDAYPVTPRWTIGTGGGPPPEPPAGLRSREPEIDRDLSYAIADRAIETPLVSWAALLSGGPVVHFGQVIEQIVLSDIDAASWLTSATASESFALTDSQAASWTTSSSISESVSIADSQSARLSMPAQYSETFGLSDASDRVYRTSASATESVALSDAQSARAQFAASSTESIALSHSQSASVLFSGSAQESIVISDSSSGALQGALQGQATESFSIADSAHGTASFAAQVSDSLAVSDSASVLQRLAAALTDFFGVSDSTVASLQFSSTTSESFALNDAHNGVPLGEASVVEVIALADDPSGRAIFNVGAHEFLALTDEQIARSFSFVEVAEALGLTDASSASHIIGGVTISGVRTYIVVAEGRIYLVPAEDRTYQIGIEDRGVTP